MYGNSSPIEGAQTEVHARLEDVVLRHRDHADRKPVAAHTRMAFEQAMAHWDGVQPLLMDSGCGVGWSSVALARQFPDHFVLGVDQSAARLEKALQLERPPNLLFVRAELADFWRLMDARGIRLARHYLLYPNPWPKLGQLQRRWHGSPVFPALLRLGGRLECRSNWAIYISELARAMQLLTGREPALDEVGDEAPLSAFERKYRDSGHALYRLVMVLP